jgi:hypothetical protein
MHVIDMDNGNDVFIRDNGAFHYLELVLPDDTMVFQDAVGGNSGIAGGAGVQTLFWISLPSATPMATPGTIDVRTGAYVATGDNKTIVYQRADTRELWVWDAVGKPANGTKVASNALNFAAGTSGPIAYVGTDHSVHVVGLDGAAVLDVAGATAGADPYSPVFISDDGADVYYYQKVESQNSRGTLMHVAATAGATPLGAGVPIGFLTLTTPMGAAPGGAQWLSAHLTGSTENASTMLVDGIRNISGALELTTPTGTTAIDPSVRIGEYGISDDLSSLVYVGGAAYDMVLGNWFGSLSFVPTAMPTMKPAKPLLTGVTEVGSVVKRSLFVNAPKAATPGVYFVTF